MEQKILSLYVNLQDRDISLPAYVENQNFIISICPYSIAGGTFSEEGIDKVKSLLKRGCLLGQRGQVGRCRYPHDDGTDPWHENHCLYNPSLSLEEQLDLMSKGKGILAEAFGTEPAVYAPINHLYDNNTLAAAQILKYRFMMDQNNMGLGLHERHGIIMIPEAKVGSKEAKESIAVYTHVEGAKSRRVSNLIKKSMIVWPDEVEVSDIPQRVLTMNDLVKRIKKHQRDLKSLKR